NSIAMGKNYAGDGDIDGDELPVAQNKTMLASILPNIETDDISFRTYACDPREYRIGKVDRAELLVGQLKAVKGRIAAEVRPNNVRRVDPQGWERPCCAREINLRECAVAKNVAVPMEEITANEFHAYDVPRVADTEPCRVDLASARKIDGREFS